MLISAKQAQLRLMDEDTEFHLMVIEMFWLKYKPGGSDAISCSTLVLGRVALPVLVFPLVCCYPTAGCFWMQWPVCWCEEASARGLGNPSEYLTLQAVISTRSRLRTCCSLRQQRGERQGRQLRAWLINKSESRGPPLVGILSSFTRAWMLLHLHIAQRTVLWGETDVEGGSGQASSSLPSPEALHMEITASRQLFIFCVAIIFPCFHKNKGEGVKKKPNDFVAALERKGGKVNLQLKAFVPSDSHVLGGGRPAGTHYTPLASAKAVTLTNSQSHNGTVVQFVFSLNPLYAGDTKAAGPDLSNMPQQRTCTKLHF